MTSTLQFTTSLFPTFSTKNGPTNEYVKYKWLESGLIEREKFEEQLNNSFEHNAITRIVSMERPEVESLVNAATFTSCLRLVNDADKSKPKTSLNVLVDER